MRKNKAMIFWFCLPALLSLMLMFVYPVCRTVLMSFFQVESVTASMSDWSFYGLGNYTKIFGSASFLTSMRNMLLIWLVGGVFTLTLAMLMAVIVTSGIRGKKFFRAAIYMPNIISAVALATMWIQYIFNYDYGMLNEIVQFFGGNKVKWLGTDLKFWAMTGSFVFGSVGYYMLIYISGIEGIPKDLYEAATIDGAGKVHQFTHITLPLVQPAIITVTIFNFMSVWNEFFMALIFTSSESMAPVGVGLLNIINSMKYTGQYGGMFAAVIIVFLPTFLLYIFMSEKIIAGVTGGGVKG